jgi:CBS domain-containing protein
MALMTAIRFRHLPVLLDEHLVGFVSMEDVVKEIISDQGFLIEQLEKYISG